MSLLLAALLGSGLGLGLLLIVAGLAGREVLIAPRGVPGRSRRRGLLARLSLAGTVGAICLAATGWVVGGLLGVVAAASLPTVLGGGPSRRGWISRTEAVAAWTEMIRDSIAAAAGLEEAITATASIAPGPIRPEVRLLARRLQHATLAEALAGFSADVDSPSADLVVAALTIASTMEAADLTGLLTRLAEATRGEARMRVRIEVGRASVRTATKVILGVVAASVILLALLNPEYLAAYDSVSGQLALLVVGSLFAAGGWLLVHMAEVAQPARFTARTGGTIS